MLWNVILKLELEEPITSQNTACYTARNDSQTCVVTAAGLKTQAALTCSGWSHWPWPPGSSPHWCRWGCTQSGTKRSSYAAAGSCPHHRSAVHGRDKRYHTCLVSNNHVRERHQRSLTHTHTHALAHSISVTQSHLFLTGAFTDTKWFGAVPSGAPVVCAPCTVPWKDTFTKWDGGSLQCVTMPPAYPQAHPRTHEETELMMACTNTKQFCKKKKKLYIYVYGKIKN